MILIPCPWCGPRNASEFRYVGEAIARPDPNETTREGWRTYLYVRTNPAGKIRENWFHQAGCRRYFTVDRDTISNAVHAAEASREV